MPGEGPSEALAVLERKWELLARRAPQGLVGLLDRLTPEERRRFWHGKRGRFMQLFWATEDGLPARSTAYEWQRALSVAIRAHQLGLVDADNNYRDRITGRKMKTILRELGRLPWPWDSGEMDDWLKQNWPKLAVASVESVRRWVRERNPLTRSVQTLDSGEG